jgi:hypothetical protein
LIAHGLFCSDAKNSAIFRQAMPCLTQNALVFGSGLESVRPSAALGWEKKVGLKSSLMPFFFAQSVHGLKCRGSSLSRSATFFSWMP